jgi:hypothetical protein
MLMRRSFNRVKFINVKEKKMTEEQIRDIFTYHAPTIDQVELYNQINDAFMQCALVVNRIAPEGPGKTVAIRKLAEARMQANASIALEGRF